MKPRERLFFGVPEMTAWRFAGVQILNILWLFHGKKELHGRCLQTILYQLLGGTWTCGNDLLYTILNTYEEEGFVRSRWQKDEDDQKKYIRYYWITDSGVDELKKLKNSFRHDVKSMISLLKHSLCYLWGNSNLQSAGTGTKIISSSMFTMLNVLAFLKKENQWFYAKEIQKKLTDEYSGLWGPSDGVLYPMLSKLEQQGFVSSRWEEGESGNSKKRTVRMFAITLEGNSYLDELLSPASGLKDKIIRMINMCENSLDFLYGDSSVNIQRLERILLETA